MEFGTFMYVPKKVKGFDLGYYRLKPETGEIGPMPTPDLHVNMAIFGDNVMCEMHPERVAMSKDGPSLRTNLKYNFRWDITCPTNEEQRQYNYELMEKVADIGVQGISLSAIHFADHGFCTCDRCQRLWKESGLEWPEWRARVVTDFIKEAKKHAKGVTFSVGLLPDPVMGYERFGFDFDALCDIADYIIIPHFDRTYATPWYFETLVRGWKKILKKPLYVNLQCYSPGVLINHRNLLVVMARIGRAGADGILLLSHIPKPIIDFQKLVLGDKELRNKIGAWGCKPVEDLIERWEQLYAKKPSIMRDIY